MCIIAIKPKGVEFPPIQLIKNCLDRNPDGFAIAHNEDGEVKVFKTMNKRKALEYYTELMERCDTAASAVVLHARIATHGSKNINNCHLWTKNGVTFAHNGIMRDFEDKIGDRTDSQVFFEETFLPAFRQNPHYAFAMARAVAREYNSRFVFLGKNGAVVHLGDSWYQAHGCLFSNLSFRDYETDSLFKSRLNLR